MGRRKGAYGCSWTDYFRRKTAIDEPLLNSDLYRLRKNLGMTMVEFGLRLGIKGEKRAGTVISRLESGIYYPVGLLLE